MLRSRLLARFRALSRKLDIGCCGVWVYVLDRLNRLYRFWRVLKMDNQLIAMKKLMELGVTAQSGKAVVSSRDIARVFEKRHDHVLRDIREITNKDPAWGAYQFGETPYTEPQNGQTYTEFNINRDGFTILVMGYTGEKAMRFKRAYIAAFNEMERRLAPQNYKEALLALVAAEEAREAMEFVAVKAHDKVSPLCRKLDIPAADD